MKVIPVKDAQVIGITGFIYWRMQSLWRAALDEKALSLSSALHPSWKSLRDPNQMLVKWKEDSLLVAAEPI